MAKYIVSDKTPCIKNDKPLVVYISKYCYVISVIKRRLQMVDCSILHADTPISSTVKIVSEYDQEIPQ